MVCFLVGANNNIWSGTNNNDRHKAGKCGAIRKKWINWTFFGMGGDDTLIGGPKNDKIYGGEGVDYLYGKDGDDLLGGQEGNDFLFGGRGHDILDGGTPPTIHTGDDELWGGRGNDWLLGRNGNDVLHGESGHDKLEGGEGDDYLHGGTGKNELLGGTGDDFLQTSDDNNSLIGVLIDRLETAIPNPNPSVLELEGNINRIDDFLFGEEGDDELYAGNKKDYLYGGDDDDKLFGEDGDDILDGGQGRDYLEGGKGNDIFFSRYFRDESLFISILTDPGNDIMRGGSGNDKMMGGDGADKLYGGEDNDFLIGNAENDELYGDDGDDFLGDYSGNNILYGGDGDDRLVISNFHSLIDDFLESDRQARHPKVHVDAVNTRNIDFEATATNYLFGGKGNDRLISKSGNDYLHGGKGEDYLYGSRGFDTFLFDNLNEGGDLISDFNHEEDKIQIAVEGFKSDLTIGELSSENFSYYVANDSNDYFIYNPATGGLSFDADGSGIEPASRIATIYSNFYPGLFLPSVTFNHTSILLAEKGAQYGTSSEDSMYGSKSRDLLFGLEGNDRLRAREGNDLLIGGEGDDRVSGGRGYDTFALNAPGKGVDTITDFDPKYDKIEISVEDFPGIASGAFSADQFSCYGAFTPENRLIYNPHTGHLFFDSDGSGPAQATLIAKIDRAFSQIWVPDFRLNHESFIISAGSSLFGTLNQDRLDGRSTQDKLFGFDGNDSLYGHAGDDILVGGKGKDTLIGGKGADTFVINSPNEGVDTILDFNGNYDKIQISIDEFGEGLTSGQLAPEQFSYYSALDADDRFIYNPTTGWLLFDEDGSGDKEGVLIATTQAPYLNPFHIPNFSLNHNSIILTSSEDAKQAPSSSFGDNNAIILPKVGDTVAIGGEGNDKISGRDTNDILAGGLGDDEIFGGNGDDLIRGDLNRRNTQEAISGGNDILHGGKGNDRIGGKTGDDQLYGNEGNDELWGGLGDDLLVGGQGEDILTGLIGADTFRFNSFEEGPDTITDFDQLQGDKLEFLDSGFAYDLVKGVLTADAFVLGSSAIDANDRFIYDQSTGSLFFDADGSGTQAAVKVATLGNNENLTHSDILIV